MTSSQDVSRLGGSQMILASQLANCHTCKHRVPNPSEASKLKPFRAGWKKDGIRYLKLVGSINVATLVTVCWHQVIIRWLQCKVCSENGKSCGPAGEPDGAGLQDAEFVLYVSGLTTERCGQENIVAYAAYCQVEPSLDSLGLYQWSDQVVRRASRLWDIRGNRMVRHEVILLITPRVVNEAMTGSHTQNSVFSTITLAIMEDTGWYRANYSMAERQDWGRGMGCDFVMKSLKFWMDNQRHT